MMPLSIHNDPRRGVLEVDWESDSCAFDHGVLRARCRCASCRAANVNGNAIIRDDVRVADIRLIGQYGVQLVFSDGHEKGIYPWTYLRSIGQ